MLSAHSCFGLSVTGTVASFASQCFVKTSGSQAQATRLASGWIIPSLQLGEAGLHSGDWVESCRERREGVPKKKGCRHHLLMFMVLVDVEETEETL